MSHIVSHPNRSFFMEYFIVISNSTHVSSASSWSYFGKSVKTRHQGECPTSFNCGYLGNIGFPFTITQRPHCGLFPIPNCDDRDLHKPKFIQLDNQRKPFLLFQVLPPISDTTTTLHLRDNTLYELLQNRSCEAFTNNYTLPGASQFAAFSLQYSATLFRCKRTRHVKPATKMKNYKCDDRDYDLYYGPELTADDPSLSSSTACTKVLLPIKDVPDAKDPFTFVAADLFMEVKLTIECVNCHYQRGGQCQLDSKQNFCCANARELSSKLKLAIGLGIGIPGILIIVLLFLFLLYKRKHVTSGGHLESRDAYSDSSLNSHRESSSVYFGVPLFTYGELKEATHNFDHTKELGDGGFGTVYYGKLPDGREVAIKRLYEHDYRRVERFMNEVEILTRLRHKNLVSLYGCTSRRSRELLLVYEYVSNGTVACHLHGGLSKPGLLPWSIRIKIAIETASALAYLHASDIIHRDVKSSNILVDNNFGVKVADFGLSRLFPNDATHVSTAPQGSPGYLDPEYYQCYQLTSKSDVYSFGVVLIELITSKPAVDMNRSKDDINLSNLAIKKIQESAIGELVDPSLGFDSDSEVMRMIVSVAGLAFQCLQRDKELRPSMDEVLLELRRIEGRKDEVEFVEEADVGGVGVSHSNVHSPPPPTPTSPEWDEVGLLKNMRLPTSPNTVTDNWESKCTTPNVSG
ncbi:LEAF RUST 10 DISEASE-RESISTANCE LOCUS RECEPTOR-LIKE PROTEIN KINASE-like 1.1 isoform X2 [Abrus precatorius]|uniref:non-specific serine/threonine protein kinase n=1 Tax=Abrus precatorius TaxID=3816 RepID=A0A8B8MD38_ABRPR|nr:LEAF RUST 10 DISEASE-RESISTANCE LOCUS RECEPTOR-LIKE PROTEIN KINASE-like 1.1 isoform X2 [Abrus precatorius]